MRGTWTLPLDWLGPVSADPGGWASLDAVTGHDRQVILAGLLNRPLVHGVFMLISVNHRWRIPTTGRYRLGGTSRGAQGRISETLSVSVFGGGRTIDGSALS